MNYLYVVAALLFFFIIFNFFAKLQEGFKSIAVSKYKIT